MSEAAFQSGYLMDISRGIKRLEIALSRHIDKPTRKQPTALLLADI